MTAVAQKTVLTGCLAPIDKNGLEQLIANGKANPKVIKTLKCKTVAEGKFRHANYIRNLPPYIVDEPPGLLGDDTAPNPSEASLAALGSCLAVGLHANAVHRGWTVNKLELELEGDLNITAVWGTGDTSEKPVGFTDVRVKVDMECEGISAGRDQRADRPCEASGRRSPTPSPGRSISRSALRSPAIIGGAEGVMGSLAVSRLEAVDTPRTHCRRGRRPSRARSSRLLRRRSTAARSIPKSCSVASAKSAPGAAMCPLDGPADLRCAIQSMAAIGEVCGATAFMAWCQNTLVWYAANSTNLKLASRFGDRLPAGRVLGGTGLSNPMKSFFGIEKLKLKGRKVEGGYVVRGALPWVSNLGPNHFFGTIFEREDAPGEIVMFLADCADAAITLQPCKPFLAMDGTGTYSVQFRDVFVPDELILAEQAGPFVKKIRAGFILLQLGMALGLIKDCINIMDEVDAPLGHVNRYLPQQPVHFKELFGELERETMTLARDPYNADDAIGARSSRFACEAAMPASRPRMRRCFIAARAAI